MEGTKSFYRQHKWKECRNAYLKHARGLCEECLKKGLIVPAEIVHHKIWLTPENINDPDITLNWANLEAVCRDCHTEIHEASYKRPRKRRFEVDAFGRVTASA